MKFWSDRFKPHIPFLELIKERDSMKRIAIELDDNFTQEFWRECLKKAQRENKTGKSVIFGLLKEWMGED